MLLDMIWLPNLALPELGMHMTPDLEMQDVFILCGVYRY